MARKGKRRAGYGTAVVALAVVGLGLIGTKLLLSASPNPPNVALSSSKWRRTVSATLYAFGSLTVADPIATVAQNIAAMNPTYVEGLVRVAGPTGNLVEQLPLSAQIISDFQTVKTAVRAVNASALFGMRIRTTQFPTAAALTTGIQQLLSQVQPDVLFFDTIDDVVIAGTDMTAQYQAAAVAACHALGVLVEFDVASKGVLGPITTQPDIFSCSDWPSVPGGGPVSLSQVGFMLGPFMGQLNTLSNGAGKPLLLHPNNSASPVDSLGNPEHYQFAASSIGVPISGGLLTTAQRQAFYQTGAQLQAGNGYALMYTIIGPTITVGPPSVDYDASHDGGILASLRGLMAQYNAAIG